MMRSLLVAVCLLASAATAHAECAWNLWQTDTTTTRPDIGPYVASAYPTVQECDTALAEEFRQLKVGGWDPHYVTARTIILPGQGHRGHTLQTLPLPPLRHGPARREGEVGSALRLSLQSERVQRVADYGDRNRHAVFGMHYENNFVGVDCARPHQIITAFRRRSSTCRRLRWARNGRTASTLR
jgi:hypothetical protein